jgi:hypothetical protein
VALVAAGSVQVLEIGAGLDFGIKEPALKFSNNDLLVVRVKRSHLFRRLLDDFVFRHLAPPLLSFTRLRTPITTIAPTRCMLTDLFLEGQIISS